MADEENSGNELAEVLADVCSAADMQTIIGTVRWRSDLPRDHTARRVNGALWWYRPVHQLWKEDRRPSERELRLKSVSRKLRAAGAVVRGLSRNDLDHLVSAGQGLAKVEERLPDVQPELVEVPKRHVAEIVTFH